MGQQLLAPGMDGRQVSHNCVGQDPFALQAADGRAAAAVGDLVQG
jgi:hypothetical protein